MKAYLNNLSLLPVLLAGLGLLLAGPLTAQTFTTLHSFTLTSIPGPPGVSGINSDGANPYAGLILSGNTLYGTANFGGSYFGGNSGNGTVFKVNTDGTGFTTLHSFTTSMPMTDYSGRYSNSDGATELIPLSD